MVSNDDPDALRSLQRELNILCKLRSKYIVQLFGSVVENRDQASFSHYNGTPFLKLKSSLAFLVTSRGAICTLASRNARQTPRQGLGTGFDVHSHTQVNEEEEQLWGRK